MEDDNKELPKPYCKKEEIEEGDIYALETQGNQNNPWVSMLLIYFSLFRF